MFTTLVESRAVRPRSARGAFISLVLHGALIAGAVALTIPERGEATPEPAKRDTLVFVIPPKAAEPAAPTPPRTQTSTPFSRVPTIAIPLVTPTVLPPIDLGGPVLPPDQIILGGPGRIDVQPGIGSARNTFLPNAIVDEGSVERTPRLVGNALAPRYPDALRASGVAGHVVVRFVIDTLGRAEMDGLAVQESTHPLFADAVTRVLGAYRFSPGEVGGRKVRTMVQLPFTFALRP